MISTPKGSVQVRCAPKPELIPGRPDADLLEQHADAERDDDRGHDEAGDGQVEQRRRADELAAEGEAGEQRHDDGRRPSPSGRACSERREAGAEIADRLRLEQVGEPVQRHAVEREGQAAVRALEAQDEDRRQRAVEEQHEQREEGGEDVEAERCASRGPSQSSLRISTMRRMPATISSTSDQQHHRVGGGGRILQQRHLVLHHQRHRGALAAATSPARSRNRPSPA